MAYVQIPYSVHINSAIMKQRTVNAVPMVSSFPCITYAKNAVSETRSGAHNQTNERRT